ncbi:hypothetical protein BCR35DRAFT_304858 [Leucosporidium creatinivorum]|uniref:Uncharacterized protein n=1 Tax=Leucosporidium creatinivorum TaxID=106004 RepID=A0A1Y2F5U0_9BASI|nr:hypothetical protein BCR35DRAFT_304858 [Leucosporidium creatinivorum]
MGQLSLALFFHSSVGGEEDTAEAAKLGFRSRPSRLAPSFPASSLPPLHPLRLPSPFPSPSPLPRAPISPHLLPLEVWAFAFALHQPPYLFSFILSSALSGGVKMGEEGTIAERSPELPSSLRGGGRHR